MRTSKVPIIVLAVILELAGGRDLYWQPNSNWDNPTNWRLGRVPNCGDSVSLTSVPSNAAVYLDGEATVKSITLPRNGRLVLGPSVTIRLSTNTNCMVPRNTEPMAASGPMEPVTSPSITENEFVGVTTKYWECSQNWVTEERFPATSPPCGADNAIFEKGSFYTVKSNNSIFVRSLTVRGTPIQSQGELDSSEFDLKKIEINGTCGGDPKLCPCPDDSFCPKPMSAVEGNRSQRTGRIAAGVVVGILALIIIIIIVIIIVAYILYGRTRNIMKYHKDELVEEPDDSSAPISVAIDDGKSYDNPIFTDQKIEASEYKANPSLKPIEPGYEEKPPLGDVPEPAVLSAMNGYEANPSLNVEPGYEEKPPLEDIIPAASVVSPLNRYEANPPLDVDLEEEKEDKHVPKLNKYQRF